MRLVIPKLDVDVPVLDGVDEQTLLQGRACMIMPRCRMRLGQCVSIAGHRNWVRNARSRTTFPLLHLHTIGPGDCLYLVDETHLPVCLGSDQDH